MSTAYFGLCDPTTGAISGDDGEDYINAGSVYDASNTWAAPAGSTVTLTALKMWTKITSGSATCRIGLYTAAGALVADTGTFALSGTTYGWVGVSGLSVAITPSAAYKFLFTSDGGSSVVSWRYKAGAAGIGQYDLTDRSGSALPGTLPTGTGMAEQIAFQATVTVTTVATTAALTGTATASITESDIVAGGKTIIATLTGDTFLAAAGLATIAIRGTTKSGNASDGGNVTLTFDTGAGAPQTGDYVVVWGGHGATVTTLADPGAVSPGDSTYSQISVHTGSAPVAGVWIRKIGATPDTQVVCSGGGNASDGVAYGCIVVSGVDGTTPQDATATVANASSTNPNCAAITTVTDGAWVLAIASSAVNDASPGTVSGYTNQATATNNDTAKISTSGMTKVVASHGAEDPAAYSSWSTGAWRAVTVALRPAATTPFNDQRQAVINGLTSAQSEAHGWNAEVKAKIAVTDVVRTSSTVATITLDAEAAYDITSTETITATIPGGILTAGSAIVASPTFTVDPSGGVAAPTFRRTMYTRLGSRT